LQDFWKIAILTFIFSMLFDLTETCIIVGNEPFFALAYAIGFILVALVLLLWVLLRRDRKAWLNEQGLYGLMIVCMLVGALGFFLEPVVDDPVLLLIIQTIGGYGFIALFQVQTAEIASRRNIQAGLIFGAVLCMQRLGNSVGELLGSEVTRSWSFSVGAYVVISLSIVAALAAVIFIVLSKGQSPSIIARLESRRAESDDNQLWDEDPTRNRIRQMALQKGLTSRETDVLVLMLEGQNSKDMLESLFISKNTQKTHQKHIYQKLGVHRREELVAWLQMHLAGGVD
jgi:DNA-binding CsgD family transcriptional regulator